MIWVTSGSIVRKNYLRFKKALTSNDKWVATGIVFAVFALALLVVVTVVRKGNPRLPVSVAEFERNLEVMMRNAMGRHDTTEISVNGCYVVIKMTASNSASCSDPLLAIGRDFTFHLGEISRITSQEVRRTTSRGESESTHVHFEFIAPVANVVKEAIALRKGSSTDGSYEFRSVGTRDGFSNAESQNAIDYLVENGIRYRKVNRQCDGLLNFGAWSSDRDTVVFRGEKENGYIENLQLLRRVCRANPL